jgi:hypothetical protein
VLGHRHFNKNRREWGWREGPKRVRPKRASVVWARGVYARWWVRLLFHHWVTQWWGMRLAWRRGRAVLRELELLDAGR